MRFLSRCVRYIARKVQCDFCGCFFAHARCHPLYATMGGSREMPKTEGVEMTEMETFWSFLMDEMMEIVAELRVELAHGEEAYAPYVELCMSQLQDLLVEWNAETENHLTMQELLK